MRTEIKQSFYKSGKLEYIKHINCVNGKEFYNKEDGPSVTFYVDNEKNKKILDYYYLNNKLNRINGPSEVWYDENGNIIKEYYYKDGKLHREDGPAMINYIENEIDNQEYYLEGHFIKNKLEYMLKVSKLK